MQKKFHMFFGCSILRRININFISPLIQLSESFLLDDDAKSIDIDDRTFCQLFFAEQEKMFWEEW